jgi:cell wall-associated NlpC family hydrolase
MIAATCTGAHHTTKHHGANGLSAPAPSDTVSFTQVSSTSGAVWGGSIMSNPFTAAQMQRYNAIVGGLTLPPKFLVKIYHAAARRYRIPWQLLAAINYMETGYGRDLRVSSAGAVGWMQFMPATWAEYGRAVNNIGNPLAKVAANPWDPRDAIFAAARYLVANGAHKNMPKAIYAYNHAGWYVDEVLQVAQQIASNGITPKSHDAKKIAAMRTMARLLNGMPYVWGGGHESWLVTSGYDCSGFVSEILHAGGYLNQPVTTQSLPFQNGIASGPGKWVTIFDRTTAGLESDHTIIDIGGYWWESGGSSFDGGAGKVHRIRNVSTSYLASFNLILHPRGL